MIEALLAVGGLAIGALIGFFLAKSQSATALARAQSDAALASARSDVLESRVLEVTTAQVQREAQLREEHERYVAQVRADQGVLREQFQALAGEALKSQSEQFMTVANERFARANEANRADLEKREQTVKQ